MPRTYRKNIVRTLKSSRGRFLSIFSIVTLGVGFLAGLNASPLDMKESMEQYMDDANFYDLRVVSSMGLSDGDVEALQSVEGVRSVQPGYSADLLVNAGDDILVARLLSLPPDGEDTVNRLFLEEGRLPQKSGECVIEANASLMGSGCTVGTRLTVSADNEDLDTTLACTEYTVVGIVHNANYCSFEREPASVGNGTVNLENGKETHIGDPTETSMIDISFKLGIDVAKIRLNAPRVNEIPFDSKRKMMTTINQVDNEIFAYTKGAPDVVLERCTYASINNEIVNLSKAEKDKILQNIDVLSSKGLRALALLSSKGLRALALCYKLKRNTAIDEQDESKMIFLGLVAMRDPPRETTAQAVKTCISAGIKPIMITGDHALTAKAIAEEVGIYKPGDIVLTGAELDEMSDEDYKKILPQVTVYARVSPQNKVQIVEAWKATGAVVAMTGDGVNDSPSIKAADIGIGMGKTGTEVTKQVADMVLTDDNFATIVGAVQEGRKTYANIKKVIQFLFGTNLVEVLSILLATLIYPTLGFLTALQILFINLVTDSLPALSLSVERAEKDVMKHPPRPKNEGLFANVWGSMLVQILYQTVCVIGTFAVCMHLTGDNTLAVTMAFAVLSISQIFHLVNVRHEHSLFVSQVFTNKTFWLTFILGIGINILIISIPAVAGVFGMMPLSIIQWLIVFGLAISIIPVIEIYKFIVYLVKRSKKAKI